MSNNKTKSKNFVFKTKPKRIKLNMITDINYIEHKFPRSCEKLNIKNKNFKNIEITNKKYIIRNIDNLEIIPLIGIDYLHSAWKSSNLINETFENIILNKNNFEINYDTLEIKTNNAKAEDELKDEKFWILYIDYLIKNNKINNDKQFIKVINNAFSELEYNFKLLMIYYLEKIKRFHPIKKDGKLTYNDNDYIDLLDNKVKGRIYDIKKMLNSGIKINISHQSKKKNKVNFYEYTPLYKKRKKE